VQARDAADAVQREWAVRSARRTLLARPEPLIDAAERGTDELGDPAEAYQNAPMPELRVACQMAGGRYEFVITDEQAKLNVNQLLPLPENEDLGRVIRRLPPRGLKDEASRLDPRPLDKNRRSVGGALPLPTIRAYGQLFDRPDPARLVGDDDKPSLVRSVTCWGDGKVNLRRASSEVIMARCADPLGRRTASLLIEARDQNPYDSLSDLLKREDRIDADKRAAVRQFVTDQSTAHGLWIVAHQGERAWHHLAVKAQEPVPSSGTGGGQSQTETRTYTYAW